MKATTIIKRASACLAVFFLVISNPLTQAFAQQLEWKRIEGAIVPGTNAGGPNVVAGILSAAFSITTRSGGYARVNLETGEVSFRVAGMALAGQNNAGTGLVVGAKGIVTMVKGTLICGADADPPTSIHDTDRVFLRPSGSARFSGEVEGLPADCPNAAFLIRIVSTDPIINDRWLAHGAVRVP